MLKPVGADQIDGMSVQRFRLELDSWFGFALPSIHMAYASDTRALREYSGISNIRDTMAGASGAHCISATARSEDADAHSMDAPKLHASTASAALMRAPQ